MTSSFARRCVGVLLAASLWMTGAAGAQQAGAPRTDRPNIVVIFTDDQGYGDLGVYGHPTIRTPNLDRMAAEGLKFTQFYASGPVCTPSRAGLLTARLAVRSGLAGGVLHPSSSGGLPQSEITMAEALKGLGYATGMVGKWHLGHLPEHLPTTQGFDSYFGIPYSNDMDRPALAQGETRVPLQSLELEIEDFQVPLMRGDQIVQRPADQRTLTRQYTEEAQRFIQANRDRPFFLYLAHNMPHLPVFASDAFAGKSPRGRYGDAVEELDWSVGQVIGTLRRLDLDERTLVIFTSDNGPWGGFELGSGSAGLLRGMKGSTWEGGMRVPALAWWPGTISPARVTPALATNLDIFPTAMELAGGSMPADRVIDGVSLVPVLRGMQEHVREVVYFYEDVNDGELYAIRRGPWKAHFNVVTARQQAQAAGPAAPAAELPLLYHLDNDPSEQFNLAANHPEILAELQREADRHRATVQAVPSQLRLPRVPTTLEPARRP